MSKLPVLVCGNGGRMSTLFADAIGDSSELELVGRWSVREAGASTGFALDRLLATGPVVLDFTHREQTRELLRALLEAPCPLVLGTSGLTASDTSLLDQVAERAPVLYAANFSVGVLLVTRFLRSLARHAPPNWLAQVLDVHHARKLDAPSATAVSLQRTWNEARALDDDPSASIASLRVGDAVSEHTVFVAGSGERIELCHRLLSRSAFVPAVLSAIAFVAQQRSGLYSLDALYPDTERANAPAQSRT